MPEPEFAIPESYGGLVQQAIDALTDHAFVLLDASFRIRLWSAGAETVFGRPAGTSLGMPVDRVFGPHTQCWDLPTEHTDGRSAGVRRSNRCWFTRPDGSRRWLETTTTVLFDHSRCTGFALHAYHLAVDPEQSVTGCEADPPAAERISEMAGHLREMTAQLDAERQERARVEWSRARQLRAIVVSQEGERGRLARDLRDHLGQQLTALKLTVEASATPAADQLHRSVETRKFLEMIAGIGRGLDAIAWDLTPAALDELGLIAVLRNYVHQWSTHARIRGSFHSGCPDGERFPAEVETTLYRIARAALEAVAEAGATTVDVFVDRRDASVRLVIEGDAVAATENGGAPGLAPLRERAAALGGSVEVEPTPAGGSAILARLPLLTWSDAARLAPERLEASVQDEAASTRESTAAEPTSATVTALRARLADLRTAVAARDEFIATVAHELRNPVAPLVFQIRLAIEKMERMAETREPLSPDWVDSQFRRVEQRLHRLIETLDRLLDASRLSTGRVDL